MTKFFAGVSGGFYLNILLLLIFTIVFLKIPWKMAAAPLMIAGTLYTLMDGYSAVCMYLISRNTDSKAWGTVLQMGISVLLSGAYFGILEFVRRRYAATLQWPAASYLYVLLLPCIFMVWFVRMGLRLDSRELEQYFEAMGIDTGAVVFLILGGVMGMFLMMIQIFCVIADQAWRENHMAVLKVQLEGQRTYVEEAGKRNQEYAKFQHDMDNHWLVLSGLIRKRDWEKAEDYMAGLHTRSRFFTGAELAPTGSGILDILLREKVNYGISSGILVSCHVRIPLELGFDHMDLAIIFANILDNAIRECSDRKGQDRVISVSSKTHGRFLVIECASSWTPHPVKEGTGLINIKNIAEKYQGTVEIAEEKERFRISVLLCGPGERSVMSNSIAFWRTGKRN